MGHGNNTSLHLAEYRAEFPSKRRVRMGAPVWVDGARQWLSYDDLALNDGDFERLGAAFARDTGLERQGRIGQAPARLMPQRALVDYAVQWMGRNRR